MRTRMTTVAKISSAEAWRVLQSGSSPLTAIAARKTDRDPSRRVAYALRQQVRLPRLPDQSAEICKVPVGDCTADSQGSASPIPVTRAYRQGRIASALAMSFVVLRELVTGHRPSGYCEPEPPPVIQRQSGRCARWSLVTVNPPRLIGRIFPSKIGQTPVQRCISGHRWSERSGSRTRQ